MLWKIFLEDVRLNVFFFFISSSVLFLFLCLYLAFCIDHKVIIYNTSQNCLLFQSRTIYMGPIASLRKCLICEFSDKIGNWPCS